MRHFTLTVRFPGGGPLIGGASTTPPGFHASHARRPDGRPYLPASALRGALRESFEAVLRGTGEHGACAGGDGIDPGLDSAALARQVPPGCCRLGANDTPCLACRLFGTQRPQIGAGERAFSGLVLGDAVLDGEPHWLTRTAVAIDRAHRSASDQQLVFQRIPASGAGVLTFVAHGRLRDATLAHYLEAAIRATTHVGSGRSRGLAQVVLELTWNAPGGASRTAIQIPESGDLLLRVTLSSPTLIGASTIDSNYRETRSEIPGAALRGAIGFALRELVDDPDGDRPTQDLLDAERGARFGFLYPAGAAWSAPGAVHGPLPITAVTCKRQGRAHGIADTLLDRLALLEARSATEAERATKQAVVRCPRCERATPLRAAKGDRHADAPETRAITRVAMDRTCQSARDGQLFSQVLLAPGATFVGAIGGIPAHSRHRLAQALTSGVLSFGRGRSMGWGQVDVEISAPPPRPPVAERAAAFDRALRDRLQRAGLGASRVGRLVPVTLLSPLWPNETDKLDEDGRSELCDALRPAACWLAARRFVREGAWDQRAGKMTAFRATAAGGVFVIELGQATWPDLIDRLEALERHGIGQRRDQGYGQVLCFDPHFIVSGQNG